MDTTQLEFHYGAWTRAHSMGKRIVCLPSIQRGVTTNVEISSSESFDFGTALEWQNYLLEYVFEFLEVKDLQSASLVNPVWNNVAERELQKRITPEWITFSYNQAPRHLVYLRTSPGLKYSNSAMALIVYCPDMIRLNQQVWLDKAYMAKAVEMTSVADYIDREIVPSGVDYCTLPCTKVTSASHILDTVIYHGIFIPRIPNIRSTMFYCDTEFKDFVNSNEQVKCVLMFNRCPLKTPDNFFKAMLTRQSSEIVAVGGGFTHSMKTSTKQNGEKRSHMNDLFCISFLQEQGVEANFNAYSLVFNYSRDIDSRYEEFETELIKLKQSSVLRKHGIIFKFCYYLHYRKTSTKLIEKHFPNYAVVGLGLTCDTVIGWNSINPHKFETKSKELPSVIKNKNGFPKSLHSQSLSLVLITWGKRCNSSIG